MSTLIERPLAFALRTSKAALKSNGMTRRLLYDLSNVNEFADLKEHERMLADATRVDTYRAGIQRAVRPGDVVVDLGTGTGILSFFAAQQGAKVVHAIDHADIINVARHVAAQNNFTNIRFFQGHSRSFVVDEPVDVVVHEQMGDHLFNEHMIENLFDLKRRVLRPGGRIVPGKFELYLEPVQMRAASRIPYIWERQIHGIDFSGLQDDREALKTRRGGYGQYDFLGAQVERFLGQPEPVLTFDLNDLEDEGELPRAVSVTRTVTDPGRLDGVCLYFRTIFDDEISFDTSPVEAATCWSNLLYRLPARSFEAGDRVTYSVAMDNISDARTWEVSLH